MLASGAEDSFIKIWGPATAQHIRDDIPMQQETGTQKAALDDSRLVELRRFFDCFCQGEIPGKIYSEEERKLAGRGKRAASMDMNEFLQFARWSSLLDCTSKTLLSSTFRAVSNHAKSDDDKHEFSFEEFCELLFRISKVAQGPAGKTFNVGEITWNRFGMISHICNIDVEILNRYHDTKGLLQSQGDMGWVCLYTLEAHLGTITYLRWLPVKDPILASVGMDDRLKLWAFTENSRGRGQWTNTNNVRAHEAMIRSVMFVKDCNGPENRVIGVTNASDMTVQMWKIGALLHVKNTLDGQEIGLQYLLKKSQKVEIPDGVGVFCTALRNDGQVLTAGCLDGSLLMWRQVEEDLFLLSERFNCHQGVVNTVCFGGDDCLEVCVTTSQDGKCCVLDTSGLAPIVQHTDQNDKHARPQHAAPAASAIATLKRVSSTGTQSLKLVSSVGSQSHHIATHHIAEASHIIVQVPKAVHISKAMLPPRLEARMFEVRRISPWNVHVTPENMGRLEQRLAVTVKTKTVEVVPNFAGKLVVRCQEASPVFDMQLSYQVNSVWYRLQAGIKAISVDALIADMFPDFEILSPIIDFTPQHLHFRKAVTVKVPHHSATTDNLVLLHCVDATPKAPHSRATETRLPAVWEPVPCTMSARHVTAHLDQILGSLVVVKRRGREEQVAHQVYVIPIAADGRPATVPGGQGVALQMGEPWQGQLELIPASSVQVLTAVTSGYMDLWPTLPLYTLTKGACISKVVPHCRTPDATFELCTDCLGAMLWQGLHLVLGIQLIAWQLPETLILAQSRPATREGHRTLHASQCPASRGAMSAARPNTRGSGTTPTRRLAHKSADHDAAAHFGLVLEDASGQELLLLEPIRVVASIPVMKILAKWGNTMQTCTLDIPFLPGSPLSELRAQALAELASPRSLCLFSRFGAGRSNSRHTRTHDPHCPVNILEVQSPASRASSPGLSKYGGATQQHHATPNSKSINNSVMSTPACDDAGSERPSTSALSALSQWPPRFSFQRPHTSAGMCAVPAARLSELHFTTGGARYQSSAYRAVDAHKNSVKRCISVEASRADMPLSVSPPGAHLTAGDASGPNDVLPGVRRANLPWSSRVQSASNSQLVPQDFEHLLPASTVINTRGYGFLVLPKTAPGGAARTHGRGVIGLRADGRHTGISLLSGRNHDFAHKVGETHL